MATLYSDTVQTILEMISDYRGESTTNTDAKRIRAVSRAEKAIAKRTNWKLYYLPDQTATTDGTDTILIGSVTYPVRNKGLVEVFIDGTLESNRYTVVDQNEFKQAFNENNIEQLCYVEYNPTTDNYELHVSPTPLTGKTVTYSYYWIPPKRTSVSDKVFCVDLEALARLALAEIYDGEDEAESAAIERNKVEAILETELGTEDAPMEGQTYSMSGNSQGYGSY